jgi:hypothetical protein
MSQFEISADSISVSNSPEHKEHDAGNIAQAFLIDLLSEKG